MNTSSYALSTRVAVIAVYTYVGSFAFFAIISVESVLADHLTTAVSAVTFLSTMLANSTTAAFSAELSELAMLTDTTTLAFLAIGSSYSMFANSNSTTVSTVISRLVVLAGKSAPIPYTDYPSAGEVYFTFDPVTGFYKPSVVEPLP